tara:strand:- start:1163 stop:2848 length:1686 start_codon:yes stop_codon:yes gene_type:complete
MMNNPEKKYRRFKPITLDDRQWPSRALEQAPIWMSTDLRDGNQALIDPMSVDTKLHFFDELVRIGFKEIEVGFPAASETDYTVVRRLIEEQRIPDDVTIEVLTQARYDLIEQTVTALKGARRVILHLYNPIAPSFREIVYKTDKAGVKAIAEQGTRWVKTLTSQYPDTEWIYQYSPETFSSAELAFSKEVCDAVVAIWQPTPENKMILNLPATVEMSTPNTYADQIEWMHRHLNNRDSIILSVHPHNDRGTGVAAAELAVMAGADRVEGCLFGNGERTGNVDLVTLALNLYTQGIDPELDFSDIDKVKQLYESCTNLPVHPRHPYAGELVFTAFSGSHQDAIKKGFAVQQDEEYWSIPYLPIDPADLNRNYDAVVRVNSQSGKGGVSFLLQQHTGFDLPRRLQVEFSHVVQAMSDRTSKEVLGRDVVNLFNDTYLNITEHYHYMHSQITTMDHEHVSAKITLKHQQNDIEVSGHGNGPVDAAANAMADKLGLFVNILDYHEHGLGSGANAEAICYVEMSIADMTIFGVAQAPNIMTAAVKALINGVNQFLNQTTRDQVVNQ